MAAKKREPLAWIGRDLGKYGSGQNFYVVAKRQPERVGEFFACDDDGTALCATMFHACTAFRLKPGEIKRVRITIEEVE